MAIWQVNFHLIPEGILANKGLRSGSSINQEEYDDLIGWDVQAPSKAGTDSLSERFPQGKSWSLARHIWGALDSTCIQILKDEEGCEVSCRIDLRKVCLEDLEAIVEFAKIEKCYFLSEEGSIFAPEVKALLEEMRRSDAFSFLKDPHAYLSKIKP